MYKYKDRNVVGQKCQYTMPEPLKEVMRQVDASATKYRSARQALMDLSEVVGESAWRTRLLPLDDADICSLRDIDDADLDARKRMKDTKYKKLCMKVAEGHISLSWIWKVVGISADGDDEGLQEGLQEGEYLLPGRWNHIGSRICTIQHCAPNGAVYVHEHFAG